MTYLSDILEDRRCEYSDLIVSQCAHCRGLIAVHHNDTCVGCGIGLAVGDTSVDNFCTDCAQEDHQ